MLLFRRRSEAPKAKVEPAALSVPRDVGAELTQALINYRKEYHDAVQDGPGEDAERARRVVEQARKMVGGTGLSRALAPTLIRDVKHWPAWSRAEDFYKHLHFDARAVEASEYDFKPGRLSHVLFTYKGERYEVKFFDLGHSPIYESKGYNHGKAEFFWRGQRVLGLDIASDLDLEHPLWKEYNLYAFDPGEWMKALIEIAVQIERSEESLLQKLDSDDMLMRARNINADAMLQMAGE